MSEKQVGTKVKINVVIDPDDLTIVQYLQSRYAKEGVNVSQAEILRRLLKPNIENVKKLLSDELSPPTTQETQEEGEGGESEEGRGEG